jgi:hypothetical protein
MGLITQAGLLVAVACALAACETTDDAWSSAEAGISACFRAMDEDPRLAVVNAKFARRDPTVAQLDDKSVPSEREAEELRLRVRLTAPCRAKRLEAVRQFRPLLEPAYTALYYQADQVFSYLQEQAITYGTANRLSAAALDAFRAREQAYQASDDAARAQAANALREQIEAAHSAPPPMPSLRCEWQGLNVECRP